MKSNEGAPQPNNDEREKLLSQEEDTITPLFQSAAGELYAKVLEINQKLKYDVTLTDEQRTDLEQQLKTAADDMETANKIASKGIQFPRNDIALDIGEDDESKGKENAA
jgi:hypothetical protein